MVLANLGKSGVNATDLFNRRIRSRWTKDLGTDVDFFNTSIVWDRNSYVVSSEDNVHSGFDVKYSNDDLNRIKRAEEGTLSGGSITSRTRDEQWTLTPIGTWDFDKVDLNGDGDFVDDEELNDDRTYNDVNELTARDIDYNGTNNFNLSYDPAGNLLDDGEAYEYVWDAFYRLRKVNKTTNQNLVAEYKYNGLHQRISVHEDTDIDRDVDSNDKWYHFAYDDLWRIIATYRENDASPKEQFVYHSAGLDGGGTGSYIDLLILRDKDANTAWTSAADGTLEERVFYCQNWRYDVVALAASGGTLLEQVRYSVYGVPFGLPAGDTNSDGDCDYSDAQQIIALIGCTSCDVRGDLDLDGDVDTIDLSLANTQFYGTILGRSVLTSSSVSNRRGLAGYEYDSAIGLYSIRRRWLHPELGIWLSRDPVPFNNLYEYVGSSPIASVDYAGEGITSVFHAVRAGHAARDHVKQEIYSKYGDKAAMKDKADPKKEPWANVSDGPGTLPNAMEHCVATCALAKDMQAQLILGAGVPPERALDGPADLAREIGRIREGWGDDTGKNLHADLANNAAGAKCSKEGIGSSCFSCCLESAKRRRFDPNVFWRPLAGPPPARPPVFTPTHPPGTPRPPEPPAPPAPPPDCPEGECYTDCVFDTTKCIPSHVNGGTPFDFGGGEL